MLGIDLFAGCGGMSLGAKWAGIDVKLAVELDPYAFETHQFNHSQTVVVQGDIRHIRNIRFKRSKSPLVVFGGPPCQGYSTSNQRTRTKKNSNNWMFGYFMDIVERVRPEWVIFENVAGITQTEGGVFVEKIEEGFHKCGYKTQRYLLSAADFGVPQKRNRFFLIGTLEKRLPEKIAPTRATKLVTVRDAISDLPILKNGASIDCLGYRTEAKSAYARMMRGRRSASHNNVVTNNAEKIIRRYAYIPQGGNWEDIPARLMKNYADRTRCHTGIYHRLSLDEPSVVIGNFRKNMLIHPTQDRGLSVREAARLQSFPDWYRFFGSIGMQQQQVGNAVPPLLAEAVFRSILTC